jgi:hypothetical protein
MLRPSSMMGEWQKEQRTLQGSWCAMDFVELEGRVSLVAWVVGG